MQGTTDNSQPRPCASFLVTSIGAYADSGIGTGGFVCVQGGEATVLDKLDSTGLCIHAGITYRFVRGVQRIVGYDSTGVCYQLKTPTGLDVHDVLVEDGHFLCVATGTNEVLWINPLGKVVRRWQADGTGDAWHLNCVWKEAGRLFFSAFGRFKDHRGWLSQCRETGFIFDFDSGADVMTGLSGPHNPRVVAGDWVVCDSHSASLKIQTPSGRRHNIQLEGFTRGLAFDEHFFYVGESANRKAEKPAETSSIAIVSRETHQVVQRITIPFPEIYEVVTITPDFADRIVANISAFRLEESSEQLRLLEKQVELSVQEADVWRKRVENLRVPAAIWGRLIDIKRSILG